MAVKRKLGLSGVPSSSMSLERFDSVGSADIAEHAKDFSGSGMNTIAENAESKDVPAVVIIESAAQKQPANKIIADRGARPTADATGESAAERPTKVVPESTVKAEVEDEPARDSTKQDHVSVDEEVP